MTPAAVEFRPKVVLGIAEAELSGQTGGAENRICEVAANGQDPIIYISPDYSGTFHWTTSHAGSDTTESLVFSAAPNMSVAASGSLTSKDYQITLDRLRELQHEEDEEDRPSDYAYDRAIRLLRDLACDLGMEFPRAIIVTGPGKSIRLLWTRNEREVRVTVGGSETSKSYIYWQASGRSGVQGTFDGRILRGYLNWLAQGM
jgi:hypothetical protein